MNQKNGALKNQQKVPRIILQSTEAKAWVGGLIQGEGCIESHYVKSSNSTTIDVVIGMTDPAPVFKFADFSGLARPIEPRDKKHYKPVWVKSISGVRAYRLLLDVLPFLEGEKLREAQTALVFFSPYAYHSGHFVPADIWPPAEFPLRKRGKYFPPKSI